MNVRLLALTFIKEKFVNGIRTAKVNRMTSERFGVELIISLSRI